MAYSGTRLLHILAEPSSQDVTSYEADDDSIIALHGLGGDVNRSWTSPNRYCWLSRALRQAYPASRIISISKPHLLKSLTASPVDVTDLIGDLIRERAVKNRSDIPIIFIGHSFGGILLKQVFNETHPLRTSQPDFNNLHQSIHGYMFLGTPHRPIDCPDIAALWRSLEAASFPSLRAGSSDLEEALSNSWRINTEFRNLRGEELFTICLYESRPMNVGIQERLLVTKVEASFESRPVELVPLDSKHQQLGMCGGQNDNNLVRILACFEKLFLSLTAPGARPQSISQERPLRLLALDGGGVKGLFTILVLRRVLEETARIEGSSSTRKLPCDYFDLIGGTSTGGLLAIMLGRLQMDITAAIQKYRELSSQIFARGTLFPWLKYPMLLGRWPWYSGDKLQNAICQTAKEHMSAAERAALYSAGHTEKDLRLISTDPTRTPCFVCAVRQGQYKVDRIRSYRPAHDSRDQHAGAYKPKIWEAARATSAAPAYFPEVNVDGQMYFDGGLESNNPVIEVIEEARSEFPGRRIEVVVSIGTGRCRHVDPHGTLDRIIDSFIRRVTNTEAAHQRVMTERQFDDVRAGYFRFQGEIELGEIDLADADKLDEIERSANDYLSSDDGRRTVERCAHRLVTASTIS